MTTTTPPVSKRFFHLDDGAEYFVIALSQEHAEQILRDAGIDFSAEGLPYDEAKTRGLLSWREIFQEEAQTARVHLNDQPGENPVPLTQCAAGDWFCSEW